MAAGATITLVSTEMWNAIFVCYNSTDIYYLNCSAMLVMNCDINKTSREIQEYGCNKTSCVNSKNTRNTQLCQMFG